MENLKTVEKKIEEIRKELGIPTSVLEGSFEPHFYSRKSQTNYKWHIAGLLRLRKANLKGVREVMDKYEKKHNRTFALPIDAVSYIHPDLRSNIPFAFATTLGYLYQIYDYYFYCLKHGLEMSDEFLNTIPVLFDVFYIPNYWRAF